MNDYDGTQELTKIKYSIFISNSGKYRNTIAHSENCLPELETQAGFSKFAGFFNRVGSISRDYIFFFAFTYICKKEDPRTGKPIDFTPESEDEVIWKVVSQKLYRLLVNP